MSCAGKCCAAFPWNRTPAELQRWPLHAGGTTTMESKYIADMLIPLTPEQARFRHGQHDTGYERIKYANRQWYTCKHWDEDTKLCGAYEQRPRMCRDFPYEGTCEHGCGYTLSPADLAVYDRDRIEAGWGPLQILLGEN